jgi:hypothetical protein
MNNQIIGSVYVIGKSGLRKKEKKVTVIMKDKKNQPKIVGTAYLWINK